MSAVRWKTLLTAGVELAVLAVWVAVALQVNGWLVDHESARATAATAAAAKPVKTTGEAQAVRASPTAPAARAPA